jgi:hypothetical protein
VLVLVDRQLIWVFWWDYLDAWFLPGRSLASNWICALGGLGAEFAFQMASSEVGAGVSCCQSPLLVHNFLYAAPSHWVCIISRYRH